jgi:hypothetical protein
LLGLETRLGYHRRESAGAHSRHAADGTVQPYRAIVLTTGNKSEMAVGYATLYGDMAGGFAVIKDVFKTFVYRLADLSQQPFRGHSAQHHRSRPLGRAQARPDRPGHAATL